ncbi:MAG TPA: anti-sigma factor [Synechococcus sp. M44_DOE_062]|nr:anti-sigma factor [Synechococcus sp. M44_DOE_062]
MKAESVSPEELQLWLAGYVLGDLSPEEADRLEALLKLRPELHRELQALQQALETAYGVEEKQPPPTLRASLLQAQAAQPMHTSTWVAKGSRLWEGGLGAVAAGLIVALGLGNLYLWRRLQLAQTQGIPAEVLTYELQPTAENLTGSVKLEVDPQRLQGRLVAQGLPPLPEGRVYALWVVVDPEAPFTTDSAGAILMAAFPVDETGNRQQELRLPPVFESTEWVRAVAISEEDSERPQEHEGSTLWISG